jgi:hypothetical protein
MVRPTYFRRTAVFAPKLPKSNFQYRLNLIVDIIDFAMAPKRVSDYVKSNDRKYRLEVVTRDPKSSAVNVFDADFAWSSAVKRRLERNAN